MLEYVSIFVVICCLVCVATVSAVGVLVGRVAWIACWRTFLLPYYFLLPSVCSDCVCSGGSSGTGGLACVFEDVSTTILFSVA